jgi:hypothetical protein
MKMLAEYFEKAIAFARSAAAIKLRVNMPSYRAILAAYAYEDALRMLRLP